MSSPVRDKRDYQNHQMWQSSGMLVHLGQALGGEISCKWSNSMALTAKSANPSIPLQRKSFDMPPKNKLQKMLQASHLKAMEIMLKGVDNSMSVVYTPDYLGIYDHSCLLGLI